MVAVYQGSTNCRYSTFCQTNSDVPGGSYSSTDKWYKFGVGSAIKPVFFETSLIGLDLTYIADEDKSYKSYGFYGSDLMSKTESNYSTIDLRIGLENWFFGNKFAIRAGGVKNIYNMNSQKNENTWTSYVQEVSNSNNEGGDSFNAGFEWIISASISVEYGLTSNGATSHSADLKYIF